MGVWLPKPASNSALVSRSTQITCAEFLVCFAWLSEFLEGRGFHFGFGYEQCQLFQMGQGTHAEALYKCFLFVGMQ